MIVESFFFKNKIVLAENEFEKKEANLSCICPNTIKSKKIVERISILEQVEGETSEERGWQESFSLALKLKVRMPLAIVMDQVLCVTMEMPLGPLFCLSPCPVLYSPTSSKC